ncbi:MAG: M4 family metallopeptidase [Pseudomonadales bacterium]|nr:M4 family metallopeptidase [Halioglobus sp.]MCP5130391.1 M4 family metallopeptidase [Pseudomonadales bacterium]
MSTVSNRSAILALVLGSFTLSAQAITVQPEALRKLQVDTGAAITVDQATGQATFMRVPPAAPQLRAAIANPDRAAKARATAFLRTYGAAFGIDDLNTQLQALPASKDAQGAEHAIFNQVHEGLPVFGSQVKVHFDRNGRLYAANGRFITDIDVNTTPNLAAADAAGQAVRQVMRQQAANGNTNRKVAGKVGASGDENHEDLKAVSTELMVFRAGQLQGVPGRDHLVYRVEVRNTDISIREFVFIDAHKGDVVDQITGIHDALDRRAYDAQGQAHPGPNYPGSPFWVEGNPLPTGTTEADNMIYASGETYDLFINAFMRDSFDGLGGVMDAIFNRGDACPNASWNGTYISFCPNVTSDDVTAHEWGHAYTEYTNNLIYQWQSGALNESYSDIWGETVDLINGRGTDSPGGLRSDGSCSIYGPGASGDNSYRWVMGEDATGFATPIRDMWTPTCGGDPGKVSDAQYYCLTGDQGGVHYNSGVPNHAYALMVDGGNYNGFAVAGIGLTKAAHIHWGAQNMLTPSSNFIDHADALDASCSALIGADLADLGDGSVSGEVIDQGDCDQVAAAIAATELRTPPAQCGFEPMLEPDAPALCEALGTVQTIAFEDFEGGLPAGWTVSSHDVANPASFDNPGWDVVGGLPAGAAGNLAAFAPDLNTGDCALDTEAGAVALDSPVIALPLNEVPRVAFDHWVATESGWDGGNLKVSVNGGPWTVVPGASYSFNPYNSSINGGGNDNPLAGEQGFTGTDGGANSGSWGQSQVNLLGVALPGDSVQLRFDLGVDGCSGIIGWYVDSVQVYSCSDEQLGVCGDSILDIGETCDDGNAASGDGCSAVCQVESGFSCSDPIPPGMNSNALVDGSFEAGPFGGTWNEFSSNFGTPICDVASCGTGTGTGPSDGTYWTWFGGIAAIEEGSVSQSVTIPATATTLVFDLEQIACDSGDDYMEVTVDGAQVYLTDGNSPLCGQLGYTQQAVDIKAYADGGVHTIEFHSEIFATNGGGSNFFVDKAIVSDNLATPPVPSMCSPIETDLACNAGPVGFEEGIGGGWSVVDNEGTGVIWTSIGNSGIGGNYTSTGDAASVSSDAAGVAEFDTELRSNSFSLATATSASLDYLVNYQNYANLDFLDVDVSVDGGTTWTNALSWNEDHPVNGLFNAPGEAVSIDLSAYLGEANVQVRWHYYDPNTDDYDWYAQVDDVALTCDEAPQLQCDIDGNGSVDRVDIGLITAARNEPALPGDLRDNDGNGTIEVSDARQCTLLCTLPRCTPVP